MYITYDETRKKVILKRYTFCPSPTPKNPALLLTRTEIAKFQNANLLIAGF